MNKVLSKTAGTTLYSAGVAAKLAKHGLSAASVVLNGSLHMANTFVQSPVKLGVGVAALGSLQSGLNSLGSYLIKKGKGLWSSR